MKEAVSAKASGVTLGAASNVVTGIAANPGIASVDKTTIDIGSDILETATVNINDTDGLNENIIVQLPGTSDADADATAIRNALQNNVAVTSKYTVSGTGADIIFTQNTNSGDVTITVAITALTPANTIASSDAETTSGVAATVGTLDKDKFTVTAQATSAGYIVVSVNDDTGLAGGPISVTVSGITVADTEAQIATKIAAALNTNAAIGAKYTVTANGNDVELEQQIASGPNTVTVTLLP